MPVFLTPSAWDEWPSPAELDKGDKSDLPALLGEQSVAVAACPVSTGVNNVRKIDPHDPPLLEPVDLDDA